ncbi:FAD-binding oxidoreductase [Acrocarpospora catenulata]|uniref:FAD-binding oxidoreductase n=1 Tax=Acrocarpospora catenulata TaxID=2836182 RepID=UPI001BDA4752|nr:2Fe-2S iron-sulfur cluster binding domain-containing protein [Acrocarpospora catenulata]
MGDKHRVRFEPVDVEIEVDEEETILDAAFRQGVMLMHGCKEGQCSSCKSFLLDGDLQMDRYSTFALADYESEEGYVLLCKAHAYSDLEIELINYDEETIRAGVPPRLVDTEVAAIEPLTHDITALRLVPVEELPFLPGQYADIRIPGTDDEWRSFSMANTGRDRLDFIIKCYPGGRFSGLLRDGLRPGDLLQVKGPYGAFTLREKSARDIVFVGGGAGMAPILSLLTQMREQDVRRRTRYYYGARTAHDLFHLDLMAGFENDLPDFRFVPVLSEQGGGLVTEALDQAEADLSEVDAYLCGPPPMIDAAIPLLESKGVPRERIYFDKFTTTAGSQ